MALIVDGAAARVAETLFPGLFKALGHYAPPFKLTSPRRSTYGFFGGDAALWVWN